MTMPHTLSAWARATALALFVASCSPPDTARSNAAQDATPAEPAPAPFELPTPTIVMEASPAPPFTYWAPEGATIRNHPNVPGIWNAFVDDRDVATHFGDDCRASEYQRFVGQDMEALPAPPPGVEVRPSCEGCAVNSDLRRDRMNVIFDEDTQTITRIACF